MRIAGINEILEVARSPVVVARHHDVRDRRTPCGRYKRRAPIEVSRIDGTAGMDHGSDRWGVASHDAILQLNRIEDGGPGRPILGDVDCGDRSDQIPIGVRGKNSILAGVGPFSHRLDCHPRLIDHGFGIDLAH